MSEGLDVLTAALRALANRAMREDLDRFCRLQHRFITQIHDDVLREEMEAALLRMMRTVPVMANHSTQTALERVTAILERARVAGGWIDEEVAAAVLAELGLDGAGDPVDREPTSPNLGHG